MENMIQPISSGDGALSAEHYQTFELAKENDSVLGGDNIAQIRSYAAYARAQAQAIHKTIAATNGLEDVAAIKSEATETAQTFAKVSIYADQRIGEILRNLEQAKRGPKVNSPKGEKTKTEAIKDSGMSTKTAYDLQAMAANPDVVQAVLDKAEQDGRIVSRSQVLKAIKERDIAKRERDDARDEAETSRIEMAEARREISALEKQNDQLYEQVQAAKQPKVVERKVEVVPKDYESLKRENERLTREYQQMWQKKRELDKRLEQANELLGEKDRAHNASRDIEQLTIATNNYLRNYGGKAWAFDEFDRVDEVAQGEFRKAITSLAAFAQNLAQMISDKNRLEGSNE